MPDLQRHAPIGRYRAPRLRARPPGLPNVHRGRSRRLHVDIYDRDHPRAGAAHTFRWLLSTCIAGAVGLIAIAVIVYGSLDSDKARRDLLAQLEDAGRNTQPPQRMAQRDGLNWAAPKSDRLRIATGALTERHIIHEQIQVRRDGRPFLSIRPYMRIVARLAPVPARNSDVIPPLNPLRLFASASTTPGKASEDGSDGPGEVSLRVTELLTGTLPANDGLELDANEAQEIIRQMIEDEPEPPAAVLSLGTDPTAGLTPSYLRDDASSLGDSTAGGTNVTVITRSAPDSSDVDDGLGGSELRISAVAPGDTIGRLLRRHGAEAWVARAMEEAAHTELPRANVSVGDELHLTMAPSPTRADQLEPIRLSLYGTGHQHKVTVERTENGGFAARDTPITASAARALERDDAEPGAASLYASLYNAALMQGLSPDTIMQLLRIHAFQTDFRRRVGTSDRLELFFDLKEVKGSEATTGELLFTSIGTSSQPQRYWRFRASDGSVDYYDEKGQNSKQFLMRRPVRGADLRLTSGFGMRYHPLLNSRRMHTGIDWAGPVGTPILAAGTGIVEEARRRGAYGNHIRIKHANGYQTTYSHMQRFAPGITEGGKVRQGQVIGYLGSTGLSSGPHLHYEVLVNSRHVDPLRLQVPRERRLAGRDLGEFQKERARIDDLMRRAPVKIDTR